MIYIFVDHLTFFPSFFLSLVDITTLFCSTSIQQSICQLKSKLTDCCHLSLLYSSLFDLIIIIIIIPCWSSVLIWIQFGLEWIEWTSFLDWSAFNWSILYPLKLDIWHSQNILFDIRQLIIKIELWLKRKRNRFNFKWSWIDRLYGYWTVI